MTTNGETEENMAGHPSRNIHSVDGESDEGGVADEPPSPALSSEPGDVVCEPMENAELIASAGDVALSPRLPVDFAHKCSERGYAINMAEVANDPEGVGALRGMIDMIWRGAAANIVEQGLSLESYSIVMEDPWLQERLFQELTRSTYRLVSLYRLGSSRIRQGLRDGSVTFNPGSDDLQTVEFSSPSFAMMVEEYLEYFEGNRHLRNDRFQWIISPTRVLGYVLELYLAEYIRQYGIGIDRVLYSGRALDLQGCDLIVVHDNDSENGDERQTLIDVSMGWCQDGDIAWLPIGREVNNVQIGGSGKIRGIIPSLLDRVDSHGEHDMSHWMQGLVFGEGTMAREQAWASEERVIWVTLVAEVLMWCRAQMQVCYGAYEERRRVLELKRELGHRGLGNLPDISRSLRLPRHKDVDFVLENSGIPMKRRDDLAE